MVAIAFYGNGTRILDVSDPTDIKQAGYFRRPGRGAASRQQRVGGLLAQRLHLRRRLHAAASTSCATRTRSRASSSRRCAGTPATTRRRRPRCRRAADAARRHGAGDAGAVARHAGELRRVHAGRRARTTPRRRTANVISTAGDGALSVADPSSNATGRLVNGTFSLPQPLQAAATSPAGTGVALAPGRRLGATPTSLLTYAGPISNDPVTLNVQAADRRQRRAANGGVQQDADVHVVDDP